MTLDTVMIFAAGRGTRMGVLTDNCPKPLLPVAGVPMIDRALALADAAGIARKLVNIHYLGDMLRNHLSGRDDIILVEETPEALETGGGLKNALPLLDRDTIFTLNPDAIWTGGNPFHALARHWDPARMDALLMLVPLARASAHKGKGDFVMSPGGQLQRWTGQPGQRLVNTGAQIIKTGAASKIAETRFSLNVPWDRMLEKGRLFGTIHNGGWVDVGTADGIRQAERMLDGQDDV